MPGQRCRGHTPCTLWHLIMIPYNTRGSFMCTLQHTNPGDEDLRPGASHKNGFELGEERDAHTARVLEEPQSVPTTKKDVLPLTEPVTRPLCLLIRSSMSALSRDSDTPVMTKVLPVRHCGWPRGTTCNAPAGPSLSLQTDIGHLTHRPMNNPMRSSAVQQLHEQIGSVNKRQLWKLGRPCQ